MTTFWLIKKKWKEHINKDNINLKFHETGNGIQTTRQKGLEMTEIKDEASHLLKVLFLIINK